VRKSDPQRRDSRGSIDLPAVHADREVVRDQHPDLTKNQVIGAIETAPTKGIEGIDVVCLHGLLPPIQEGPIGFHVRGASGPVFLGHFRVVVGLEPRGERARKGRFLRILGQALGRLHGGTNRTLVNRRPSEHRRFDPPRSHRRDLFDELSLHSSCPPRIRGVRRREHGEHHHPQPDQPAAEPRAASLLRHGSLPHHPVPNSHTSKQSSDRAWRTDDEPLDNPE
jgi:hypothetical protein